MISAALSSLLQSQAELMERKLSKFQHLLKSINRRAGSLPPDAERYMRAVDEFMEDLLPFPSRGFIKAHGKLTVYSHLLERALDEVSEFERRKN